MRSKPEEFAIRIASFDNAIGDEGELHATVDAAGGLNVDRVRRDAQGKAVVDGEFFPVEVWGDVAGIGDSQCCR